MYFKIRALSILCALFVWSYPLPLEAQENLNKSVRLSFEFENTPIVEVLNYIQRMSNYEFLYNNEEIQKIPPINITCSGCDVKDVLDICLNDSDYTYQISRNVIVIQKKRPAGEIQWPVTIQGRIIDEKNQPIPGATLLLAGTYYGVSSDAQGRFSLQVPQADTIELEVSFVGMKKQTIILSRFDREVIIKMQTEVKSIEEVVVTGYGNIRKSSFTGNSVHVTREELQKVSKTNIISAIQVFDPSFRIKENNQWGSDPNSLPEMQIRGQSSIGVKDLERQNISKAALQNNPNLPIFIMDGFEVSIEKVYDMDPYRIESMTILKDAAATALYGSRASNGIVVITTVKPKEGQLHVSYNLVGSVVMPDLTDYNLMNAREKMEAEIATGKYNEMYSESWLEEQYREKMLNILSGVNTYWLSKPLHTVFNHQHSLRLEGNSGKIRYALDLLYNNEDGVMKQSYRDRLGTTFTFQYQSEKLEIQNQISYTHTKAQESPYGNFSLYTEINPYEKYQDEKGNILQYLKWTQVYGMNNLTNPLYEAQLGNFDKTRSSFFSENLMLNWRLLPSLLVKGELGVNYDTSEQNVFVDPESAHEIDETDRTYSGSLTRSNMDYTTWEGKLTVSYLKSIGKHDINFLAGANIRTTKQRNSTAKWKGFQSAEFPSPTFAREINGKPIYTENSTRLFGVLGTLNYSYDNIYLLDASLRMDGSSEFGADKRYAPFWSGGIGLNLHNYAFLKENSVINQLKIRGSFGQTGKVNFSPYAAVPTHEIFIDQWYITGPGSSLMYTRGNKDLKWEKSNKLDIGFELGLWQNKVYLAATWYNEITNGLITDVTLPSSTGFSSYTGNMGKVENKGFELNLRIRLIQNKNWYSAVYFNMAHNTNKIKKISDALKVYNEKINEYYTEKEYLNWGEEEPYQQVMTKYEEGQSLTAKFGLKSLGIDPASGQELYQYRNGRIGYEWKAGEMQNIGDESPWGTGAFGLNLQWKGITFYTSFLYEFGGKKYNSTLVSKVENANISEFNVDRRAMSLRWHQFGDIAQYQDISQTPRITYPTSRFMQKNNVLEWRSITLGYELPIQKLKKIGVDIVRLEVGAENLWRLSSIETERGLSYPFANTLNFSLKIDF